MKIKNTIEKYFDDKISQFGSCPEGVGWNSDKAQIVRFDQISKIIAPTTHFSINDIGCGYGKYYEYLKNKFRSFEYHGNDLSQYMIEFAQKNYPEATYSHIEKISDINVAEYTVASGIFNLKFSYSNEEWLEYVLSSILELEKKATKGLGFNLLTNYSDMHLMKDELFYADPLYIFDFCKKNISPNVALLHDYDLYDFTILVRK